METKTPTVTEQVPTGVHLSAANARYLATKARHRGHALDAQVIAGSAAGCEAMR